MARRKSRGRSCAKNQTTSNQLIERKLQKGCRFFHVRYRNATVVFLAKTDDQAIGLFRLYMGHYHSTQIDHAGEELVIVNVTNVPPRQFAVFAGRRNGRAQVRLLTDN